MNMTFHQTLQQKMDDYVHLVYRVTRNFPKDEIYGARSQIRRSALSVILNYTEGYARQQKKVLRNFLQISYGSL
jgi:four helix bundle protein